MDGHKPPSAPEEQPAADATNWPRVYFIVLLVLAIEIVVFTLISYHYR